SGNRAVAVAVVKDIQASGANPVITRTVATEQRRVRAATKAFIVGLRKPFSSLGHLFEFGTAPRYRKDGSYAGQMPATPWIRPALERIAARAEAIWTKAASRNLERQLRKLGRGL